MLRNRILIFFIALLLGSCASYMPVSEGIIYHDQDREPYAVEDAFPFPYGESAVTISHMILPGPFRDAVRDEYEEQRFGEDRLVFRQKYLIAPPVFAFSIPLAYKAAAGISVFPLYQGFDATVHLFEDTWLTGSLQFPLYISRLTNAEVILQRPVYRMDNGGVSAGVFYRHEHLNFFGEGEQVSLSNLVPATFPVDWFGGRISAQIPYITSNSRIRIHFHGGYSGRYEAALFSFGISISSRPGAPLPKPIQF